MSATLQPTIPGSQYQSKLDANTRMYVCVESEDLGELERLIDEKALQGYCVAQHSMCSYTTTVGNHGSMLHIRHCVIMKHSGITHDGR